MTRGLRVAVGFAIALFFLAEGSMADTAAQTARGKAFRVPVPALPSASFRFLPDGDWRDFDRPLLLDAMPGEERQYSLEIRDSSGTRRYDYLVDRLPPPPPQPDPPPGSFAGPLSIRLSGEEGSVVLFSLSGPGLDFGPLATWNPERPLILPSSDGQTGTWVLVAQAIDQAGNASSVSRFVYKIVPPGIPASGEAAALSQQPPRADAAFDPGIPAVENGDSSAIMRFAVPSAGRLVAAVGAGTDLGRVERWQPLEVEGRLAALRLLGPYGWSGDLAVSIGVRKDDVIRYWPTPYSVHLSPLVPASKAAVTPEAPRLIAGEPGSSSLLVFPPYDGDILYSLDGGSEIPWRGPIPLAAGEGSVLIKWKGLGSGMEDSPYSSLRLDRPPSLPQRPLLGLDGPAVRASAFRLAAAPGVTLRYQLAEGKAFPEVVSSSSPLMSGELIIDTAQDTTRIVTIRYRAYSGAADSALGGEEGFARLTVDRQAPPPPSLLAPMPAFSRGPVRVALGVADDSRIMVELDDGSGKAIDSGYKAPVLLEVAGSEARAWRLSAWAVDEAGNVSPKIGPYPCVIDPIGLYVDQGAMAGGQGSPDAPFASIEAALAAAQGEESVLRVRSGYTQRASLTLNRPSIRIVSGSSLSWLWPDSPEQGILTFAASSPGKPSITVSGGKLILIGIDARFGEGEGEAISVKSASLEAGGSSFTASTRKSLSLIDASSSLIKLKGVFLKLGGSGGGADLVARDSAVDISNSDIGATGTTAWISCLSVKGGSLGLRASRLGAAAGISSVGISAESTKLALDRAQVEVLGTAGYRRGAIISSSSGSVLNSRIVSTGPATTIVELHDAPISFVFDSFIDEAVPKGSLVFSARGGNPLLVDDLFIAKGGARLLESDRGLEKGGIGACAFAGFGPLVSGASTIVTVSALPAFASGSGRAASIDLGGASVLRSAPKGGYELVPASPIVDAGIPFGPDETSHDFSGLPRPSVAGLGLPDIGADELR